MSVRRKTLFLFCALAIFSLAALFTFPLKSFAENDEAELFLVAQKAFDDGFYDVAIRYIEQFQEKYPQNEKHNQANLILGQCYYFKGQYLKAFGIFQDLLRVPEYKDATLFWLAETYLKGSDYLQAANNYKQLIDVYPTSIYLPQAYYSLGWTYFEAKEYLLARDTFTKFIQIFPAHELIEDATFKLGECAYSLHMYEEVIKNFQDYVTKFPQSPRHDQAYFYIAESSYYLENLAQAIDYYTKALAVSKDDKIILLTKISLGWNYLKLKEFDKAKQFFDEAQAFSVEKNIPSDDIQLGQANLFFEMADYPNALAAYTALIEKSPNSPRIVESYMGKANSLYLLQDYKGALAEYQRILEQFSGKPDSQEIIEKSHLGLAWTYLKLGETDSAIKNFQDVIDKTGNKTIKVSALTQIGDAYQDTGNFEKALETYDKIIQDFPDSLYTDYVQYRQGIALLKINKAEAATLSFQSLQTNFPQSRYLGEVKYYLGVAYFRKGDWANAKAQLADFINEMPKTSEFQIDAQYLFGVSIFNLGDYAEANKIFQKIVKNYPQAAQIIQDAELNIAKCLFSLSETKEALTKFKIIAYKYPRTDVALEALFWLGDYYLKSADFDNAITYFQQLIEFFPASDKVGSAHYNLGQAYQKQELFDKALNEYKQINPSTDRELYAKAALAIADIFAKEANPDTAIETYRKVTTNSPEFARNAYLKIAEIYQSNRDYQNALEAYRSALGIDPGLSDVKNVDIQFAIADTYETLNKPNDAVESYLKIPYLYPEETAWINKAYLRIARIFEDEEDWQNAKLIYQKIIGSGTDEVKFAQERIDWINKSALLKK